MMDNEKRYQAKQKAHTIMSGIWLLLFSALFVALLVYADSENYLSQEDDYLQAVIYLILTLAILTWTTTVIWIIQRRKPTLISLGHPVVKYVVAGIIIAGCISFVVFLLLANQAYGSYLEGEYSWGYYVVFVLVALFLFSGAWHLARLARPDFIKRKERPYTRKGPRVLYVALCMSILAGAGSLFASIATQATDPVIPYQFTLESGTTNTSVILLIGDGMGPAQMQLGKLVEYGPSGNAGFDRFNYTTTVSTSNVDGGITDSAAGATAIGTGTRTSNGRLAMSVGDQNLTTILEIAQRNGYATGLIAKCQLAHATPAAFASHKPNRDSYSDIVPDMVGHDVDVLLGGGQSASYFGSYVSGMEARGYTYATNKTEMAAIAATPAIGLFSSGDMPKVQDYTDSTPAPSMLDMVVKGIGLLKATGKPYFLMVEESAIDWAVGNTIYAAHEMIMFDKIINYTINLALADPKLQVLLTADHETGGLQILGTSLLTGTLPDVSESLAVNTARRTTRAGQVSVAWTAGGHTNTKVILAGIGPYTSQIAHARFNIDTFSLMRMAIEGVSGPVEQGINDDNMTIVLVYIAFGGMIGTAAGLAILFILKNVKRKNVIFFEKGLSRQNDERDR